MTSQNNNDSGKRRRDFLRETSAAVTGGGLIALLAERGLAQPVRTASPDDGSVFDDTGETSRPPKAVFPQSVASGGPTPSGVLVWTRISRHAHAGEPLGLEVAADRSFEQLVHRGTIESEEITPAHDYTVTVDLDGLLSQNSRYFYQFTYDGVRSPIGRCGTLPGPNESPESISCVVMTCQDYQNGYYGAYSHVADEDVDFVIHLGDFIYESAAGQYKSPWSNEYPDRTLDLPSGGDLAASIADFRYLYNTYRSDPHLQKALERHTLIAGWDDHEVANNRYWDYETDSPHLPPHQQGDDPSFATRVTAAGIQAWVEQMPARIDYEPAAGGLHEQFTLRRSFRFGDLASLAVTDERLFRDPAPGQGISDRERTMLGDDQLEWFLDEIGDSQAMWNVWANEVLTMSLEIGEGDLEYHFNKDAWDGYQHERKRIMNHLAESEIENFITLTGDYHTFLAGYQQTDYELLENDETVGVEFMTPAVTSVNLAEIVPGEGTLDFTDIAEPVVTTTNPHIEAFDSTEWGYSVVEFTPEECTFAAFSVDKTENSSDAEKQRLKTLRVPEGEIEIQTVGG